MGDDDISEAALGVALVDSELLHRVLVQIPFRLEAALTDRDHGIRASTISALHCRMMIMTILIVIHNDNDDNHHTKKARPITKNDDKLVYTYDNDHLDEVQVGQRYHAGASSG